jgi:nitrogen regulatory protein PII
MTFSHQAIFCIVNSGYSEAVMDAAKKFGARGGTVLSGRGTANPEAEKMFGITVEPEKEIVMILVSAELKDRILSALYDEVGLNSPGQGIAFALPVDSVVGLSSMQEPKEKDHK